jgi:hypothetical protein
MEEKQELRNKIQSIINSLMEEKNSLNSIRNDATILQIKASAVTSKINAIK